MHLIFFLQLRQIFAEAEQKAPSIIFFDEIDAISSQGGDEQNQFEKRIVGCLIGLMDGVNYYCCC